MGNDQSSVFALVSLVPIGSHLSNQNGRPPSQEWEGKPAGGE